MPKTVVNVIMKQVCDPTFTNTHLPKTMDKSIMKLNDNLECEEPLSQCLRARMEATTNL